MAISSAPAAVAGRVCPAAAAVVVAPGCDSLEARPAAGAPADAAGIGDGDGEEDADEESDDDEAWVDADVR